jgi:hypothetical protein
MKVCSDRRRNWKYSSQPPYRPINSLYIYIYIYIYTYEYIHIYVYGLYNVCGGHSALLFHWPGEGTWFCKAIVTPAVDSAC